MNWSNLKDMLCPQCKAGLKAEAERFDCLECDFSIGKKKFEDIIVSLYKIKPRHGFFTSAEEDENRHEDWNNHERQ